MSGTIAAVSRSPAASASVGGNGTAGLEAQVARYEKELADCVNCASAKTPEGKKAIADLSTKIGAAHERIKEIQAGKTISQPSAAAPADARKLKADDNAASPGSAADSGNAPLPKPVSAYSTIGSVVDVFG